MQRFACCTCTVYGTQKLGNPRVCSHSMQHCDIEHTSMFMLIKGSKSSIFPTIKPWTSNSHDIVQTGKMVIIRTDKNSLQSHTEYISFLPYADVDSFQNVAHLFIQIMDKSKEHTATKNWYHCQKTQEPHYILMPIYTPDSTMNMSNIMYWHYNRYQWV